MPIDANRPIPSRDRIPVDVIHARVRRYNSDIDAASDTFRAAVLLLAALEYGQNVDVLTRRTGIDRGFVSKCARRLIDNGVWSGGRTVAEWSAADEASGSFWNDVAVAEGKLCRRAGEDGSVEWAPAGYWNKSYHFVDPNADERLDTVYFDAGERVAEPTPLADEIDAAAESAAETATQPSGSPAELATEVPAPDASAGVSPEPVDPAPAGEAGTAGESGEAGSDAGQEPPTLSEIFSDAVWLR